MTVRIASKNDAADRASRESTTDNFDRAVIQAALILATTATVLAVAALAALSQFL